MPLETDGERPAANAETVESAEQVRSKRIAELNDLLRMHRMGGRIMMTRGVRMLGTAAHTAILIKLTQFSDFTPDNDPYNEHDFGTLEQSGFHLIWKIDYYDRALRYASPDPADPGRTTRVLTVMLAEEY